MSDGSADVLRSRSRQGPREVGGFEWRRTTGDHAQLYYEHPENEDDRRHVTVLLHDELRRGTLRSIAEQAGANDFRAFCEWVDRNA